MKLYDNRRPNALINDELETAEEYHDTALKMREKGFIKPSDLYFGMAEDEARHAEIVEIIKNKILRGTNR